MMKGLVIVTEDVADAFLGDEGTNLIEELDNVEIITHVNGVEAIDIGTARQAAIPSGDNEIALTIKGANGTYEWFLSLKERSSAPVFNQCACVDEARWLAVDTQINGIRLVASMFGNLLNTFILAGDPQLESAELRATRDRLCRKN